MTHAYRPTAAVSAALREIGIFASDTTLATAWAAATVLASATFSRSRWERANREALVVALAANDLAAAERAAVLLADDGAAMQAAAAEARAEYEARRDAERAADAAHAAEVARRRAAAAPVVVVAAPVEAPARKAAPKAARARKDFSAANTAFLARLPADSRARLDAWAEVRGTDALSCLCGCGYPSTRCPRAAQTARAS